MTALKPDFSGWATKADLLCTDGRTIERGAFAHQDKVKVPLVYMHQHTNPENILGHAILEHREEGVWTEGFFNETAPAKHMKHAIDHGDITQMSIWANQLKEAGKRVLHGAIREVSLVISGANPGANIVNVTLQHDGFDEVLEDEVIIYTGLPIAHGDINPEQLDHADGDTETFEDIFETLNEKQRDLFVYAIAQAAGESLAQSSMDGSPEMKEIYEAMSDEQKTFVHLALAEVSGNSEASHSDIDTDADSDAGDSTDAEGNTDADGESSADSTDTDSDAGDSTDTDSNTDADAGEGTDTDTTDESKGTEMTQTSVQHNAFEGDQKDGAGSAVLSHDDLKGIVADAMKSEVKLSEQINRYALQHGIQDIDVLFPEAKSLMDTPEFFSRRTEWVNKVMSGVRKSPFARIKTVTADITVQEARAKGYITGNLKKDEFFRVAKRITTPTTIYKKQKLDRDDMVDITDFDVVTWLKGEMRLMLDEELARAVLLGDGRDSGSDDKINEDCIRPIATDHELYTTVVNVNIDDASSSVREVLDAIVRNRRHLRGSGLPTMFCAESLIAEFMLLRDGVNRALYNNLTEVAAVLRVESIVPVEIMEEEDSDIVCILVNLSDYVLGADKGGNVSLFDDFDIDYNQYKYLIETRVSGALAKFKSALVVKKVAAASVLIVPSAPTQDPDTKAVTIVNTANVVYRRTDTDAVVNAAGSPYAVAEDTELTIEATPAAGFHFADSEVDDWTFTNLG